MAKATRFDPIARVSAPLAGAVMGEDVVVPGAVDEGAPVPEAAGVVELPVG